MGSMPSTAHYSTEDLQEMHPEWLGWLRHLYYCGAVEWKGQFEGNPAAHCRERGMTAIRMVHPELRVLHELTPYGRDLISPLVLAARQQGKPKPVGKVLPAVQ